MNLTDIKSAIDQLGDAHEQFRKGYGKNLDELKSQNAALLDRIEELEARRSGPGKTQQSREQKKQTLYDREAEARKRQEERDKIREEKKRLLEEEARREEEERKRREEEEQRRRRQVEEEEEEDFQKERRKRTKVASSSPEIGWRTYS